MIGLLVIFAITWGLLWLITREHITVLGFRPTRQRLKELGIGMTFMFVCCAINQLWQAHIKGHWYVLNPDYGILDFLAGTFWIFKAGLLEELVFRGTVLFLLIRWLGPVWGCIVSAVAFGMYHWHSYEVFGRGVVVMAYVFILTGAAGWAFAYSFAKTKSLYAPFGLHFGWIIFSGVVVSEGPLGPELFIADGPSSELPGWPQLGFFLFQSVLIPGLITWYLIRNYPNSQVEEIDLESVTETESPA